MTDKEFDFSARWNMKTGELRDIASYTGVHTPDRYLDIEELQLIADRCSGSDEAAVTLIRMPDGKFNNDCIVVPKRISEQVANYIELMRKWTPPTVDWFPPLFNEEE